MWDTRLAQWKRYRPDTKRMAMTRYAASATPVVDDRQEKETTMARPGDLQVGWQYRAACKGPQSHLFFAPNHIERKQERLRRERAAKAICRQCPVLEECREYALVVREQHGIWGGMNEYERRQTLARRAG
jgi:WhiB family redox-sensing transcriptional regulator